ncbi:hypothetical protein D082_30360 [Synechocystis sp. PCC 6714]|nr:hypothetical protein D082_30360 [Synechocystis sp. PCC 6714]
MRPFHCLHFPQTAPVKLSPFNHFDQPGDRHSSSTVLKLICQPLRPTFKMEALF